MTDCIKQEGHSHYTGYLRGCKCDDCNESAREAVQRLRAQWRARLDEIQDVPCIDCGGSFPPECMDFDHVRGEKKFNISQGIRRHSWQAILDEIDKCDIVCANCHRTRTRLRLI